MGANRSRATRIAEPGGLGSVSDGLGGRLRAARERTGQTVRGLARTIGVSASLVSQIENGRVMPSVGTLYAIANELGLLVDDLFRAIDGGEAASGSQGTIPAAGGPVQRHDTRLSIRLASGVRWELLTPAPDDEVEFLYVEYDVGGQSCAEDLLTRHGGKEYAFVISGRLGVRVGFREYELGPGDSMTFDAQMPHRLWTVGDAPAIAIWVVLNRHGDARKPLAALAEQRRARRS